MLAAVSLALLAVAAGGALGNFGNVGVDQATLIPGVLFWFGSVGGLTVVMAGGLSPRAGRRAATAEDAAEGENAARENTAGENTAGENTAGETSVEPRPENPLDAADTDADADTDAEPEPEPEPEPGPPPPPVKPAPYLEDVEDLMFVDADIEADRRKPPR